MLNLLKKIAPFAFLAMFIGCIIGAVAFSKSEPRISVICAGTIFFVTGLTGIFSQKLTRNTLPILLFPIVGAGMIIIPALLMYSEKNDGFNFHIGERFAANSILTFLMLIGICILVIPPVVHKKRLALCTETVEALCINMKSHLSGSGKGGRTRVYAPDWEYYFDGNTYVYQETSYSNMDVPTVGETYQLLLNPDKPDELYRPSAANRRFLFFMGLAFAGMSLFGLIMYNSQF